MKIKEKLLNKDFIKTSVTVHIILVITGICLLIAFVPIIIDLNRDSLMSFIELIIEGIFCILVLKEFKMTRKSFEWQKEEKNKAKIRDMCNAIFYGLSTFFRQNKETIKKAIWDNNTKGDILKMIKTIENKPKFPASLIEHLLTTKIDQTGETILDCINSLDENNFEDTISFLINFCSRANVNDITIYHISKNIFKNEQEISDAYNYLFNL